MAENSAISWTRKARRDKEWAERAIAEWEEKIRRIEDGDLEVYL